MILREWRGRADYDREDAYPAHFRSRVVPELRHVSGFLGAYLVQRDIGGAVEFTVMTKWTSMDAVRAFAGNDVNKAVVESGAVEALSDFDEHVSHHDILEQVASGAG